MNGLSWLIYLAGVLDGFQGIFIGVTIILLMTAGIFAMGAIVDCDYGPKDAVARRLSNAKRAAIWAILPGVLAALIPSSGTVYAIAASEVGERALTSATGGKAVAALNAWLDRQIAGKPEKSDK